MIVGCGLSPAWQQVFQFQQLASGEVNRAHNAQQAAAGKVLNAAKAVVRLGSPCTVVTTLGGDVGTAIATDVIRDGIELHAVQSATPSRICVTVIEEQRKVITELVENASPLSAEDYSAFVAACQTECSSAAVVLLCGSLPPGAPRDIFRRVAAQYAGPVIADVRGEELQELLSLRPLVVKPNRSELAATLGSAIESRSALIKAMQSLCSAGAQWVVVSQGGGELLALHDREVFTFVPPTVPVVNTIGCGDALTAGIAVGLARGETMVDAITLGLATAADNASQLSCSDVMLERVQALLPRIASPKRELLS